MNKQTATAVLALTMSSFAAGAPFSANAQSVPDLGSGSATVSSVQATACTPPSPVADRYNYCGWGVWSIETQRSTVIASLSAPASYLICREQVDASEPNGFPVSLEVDGVVVAGGAPSASLGQAPAACSLVSGKKIVITGQNKPNKPARGYYIRLGPTAFANTVSWSMRKGGGSAGDRVLLSQAGAARLLRVCFGNYNPVSPTPAYLREYRLWVDSGYTTVRGSEPAVYAFASCTDIEGAKVGVEPRWVDGEPGNAFGRLTF